jgi:hypothetical protein
MVPGFLILGTMKGGTTSLYASMGSGPKVISALTKEVHYFDCNYAKGWTWYLAHFPIRTSDDTVTGEATPDYLFFPEVAQRVAEVLPKCKLIVMLRNPIDRAYSHYQHEVARGYESLSFESAIQRECMVGADGVLLKPKDLRERGVYAFSHFSYLSRGLYAEQLKLWMQKIPRKQFLILKSESFFKQPDKALSEVLEFLGLPSTGNYEIRKYNEGHYPPLGNDMRSRLRLFYAPYNEQLSQLVNMDFRDWT